jgi:hypothetical protein
MLRNCIQSEPKGTLRLHYNKEITLPAHIVTKISKNPRRVPFYCVKFCHCSVLTKVVRRSQANVTRIFGLENVGNFPKGRLYIWKQKHSLSKNQVRPVR